LYLTTTMDELDATENVTENNRVNFQTDLTDSHDIFDMLMLN